MDTIKNEIVNLNHKVDSLENQVEFLQDLSEKQLSIIEELTKRIATLENNQ